LIELGLIEATFNLIKRLKGFSIMRELIELLVLFVIGNDKKTLEKCFDIILNEINSNGSFNRILKYLTRNRVLLIFLEKRSQLLNKAKYEMKNPELWDST